MRDFTIHVAKTNVLISCAVAVQLVCNFVFSYIHVYAKNRFSHDYPFVRLSEILFIIKMGFMAIFQIQELLNGHVHIRDKEYVGKVLEKMIKDGPDKLQVGHFFFFALYKNYFLGKKILIFHLKYLDSTPTYLPLNSLGSTYMYMLLLKLKVTSCLHAMGFRPPVKPHLYIGKLRYTEVLITFLIFALKHRLSVLIRTTSF